MLCTTFMIAQPVCPPNFPVQSPVPSTSPDDIPPTNIDIITYTGSLVKARANHNIAYVEVNPNDQRVWFGVDSAPGLFRTFYNRRVRDNGSSPWRWLYSYSPTVIQYQQPTSVLPGNVLYSPTARYRDPGTNTYYQFIMFQVIQPGACDGAVAGFLYYSLSDDGVCWTTPAPVSRTGGPSFPCRPGATDTVPIVQVTAIDGGAYLIYLVGMEGDFSALIAPLYEPQCTDQIDNDGDGLVDFGGVDTNGDGIPDIPLDDGCLDEIDPRREDPMSDPVPSDRYARMDRTQTYLGWVDVRYPGTLQLPITSELSSSGLSLPKDASRNNVYN